MVRSLRCDNEVATCVTFCANIFCAPNPEPLLDFRIIPDHYLVWVYVRESGCQRLVPFYWSTTWQTYRHSRTHRNRAWFRVSAWPIIKRHVGLYRKRNAADYLPAAVQSFINHPSLPRTLETSWHSNFSIRLISLNVANGRQQGIINRLGYCWYHCCRYLRHPLHSFPL